MVGKSNNYMNSIDFESEMPGCGSFVLHGAIVDTGTFMKYLPGKIRNLLGILDAGPGQIPASEGIISH